MADFERFDHNGAEAVLKRKGLLAEIENTIKALPSVGKGSPHVLQGLLSQRGWDLEVVLLKETGYRHDAFKDGVLVEIDLRGSLLDAVHRNFLRAQELHNRGLTEVLVQVVEMEREPKFGAMKRDITAFKSVLRVPIYLIGLR